MEDRGPQLGVGSSRTARPSTAPSRGRSVERGVRRRSRVVVGPWWVRPTLPLRGLLTRPTEIQLAPIMPEVEQLLEQELREKGDSEVSTPIGAGGRAAP